jgi:FkbM family methyltransferase
MRSIEKLARNLGNAHYRRGLRYGVAAAVEHERFLSTHKYQTIIDGGANFGQFSLAARRWQPNAQIIAFEPIAECAAKYRAIFKDDDRAEVRETALGSSCGSAVLNIYSSKDASSMFALGGAAEQRSVPVTTLDAECRELELAGPALLKLDVQGMELETLKGAESTLTRVSDLYVEILTADMRDVGVPEASEVIGWLQVRGFGVRGVYDIYFDERSGTAAAADLHFSR